MALDSKQFIIDLAKQLNLNNMDDATRARLKDLKDKGVATTKQQGWDPTAKPPLYTAGAYGGAVVGDLKEIYNKLAVVLRDMYADEELRERTPATKKFLDKFYGAGKAVESYESAGISPKEAKDIGKYITKNLSSLAAGTGVSERDLKSLADTLTPTPPTYANNAKSLKTLNTFLLGLYNWNNMGGARPIPNTDLPDCFKAGGVIDYDKILAVRERINTPKDPIDPQLKRLRDNINDLFGQLVSNEKLFEKFSSKDEDGDLTKWIQRGIDDTNYKTGDHALTPKYKDRKQFWDDAKKKINDWYTDTLGKLESKHKRHIYQTNARYIVDELIKKGVKPTDGTGKILETLDAIRGELPNPVQKQLDWIKDTLTPMSKTSFFKDALRDGDQMNTLVSEIIKAAAHDDKEKEAMVALEMLAVMRYTLTTSSVRDQLQKTEFKLLSDPNLSFNKGNSFMQSFTSAIDKTLKFGMMAAFEVGNLAKNAIKQQGLKYGKGKDSLNSRITDSVQYKAGGDKQKMMERLFGFWNIVNSSANTKDYNIFKRHEKVQEAADNKVTGNVSVTLAGAPTKLEYKTEQERRYLEYLRANNIGRAA